MTQRLLVLLSAAFGGLAALLAALGVYGVLAFAVEQRRQEIGARIALGADPGSVRRLILSEVGGLLLVGGAIGVPAASLLARGVESILFGVRAADVSVFAGGVALIAAVSLAAALPPAVRAARINATDALRIDRGEPADDFSAPMRTRQDIRDAARGLGETPARAAAAVAAGMFAITLAVPYVLPRRAACADPRVSLRTG